MNSNYQPLLENQTLLGFLVIASILIISWFLASNVSKRQQVRRKQIEDEALKVTSHIRQVRQDFKGKFMPLQLRDLLEEKWQQFRPGNLRYFDLTSDPAVDRFALSVQDAITEIDEAASIKPSQEDFAASAQALLLELADIEQEHQDRLDELKAEYDGAVEYVQQSLEQERQRLAEEIDLLDKARTGS